MLEVHVSMRIRNQPLKRTPVTLFLDQAPETPQIASTDRDGVAVFDIPPTSGKISVMGAVRYHGHLEGRVDISLWSPTDGDSVQTRGAPGGSKGGSTAYPNMKTRTLRVNGHEVITDSEGYLVDLDDWSEDFVRAEAAEEGLALTPEHWEVIRYLRDFYEQHHLQANVREIIKEFRGRWGRDKASNRYLHDLFPRGGPQKQGNRLAGLLRVKGEH